MNNDVTIPLEASVQLSVRKVSQVSVPSIQCPAMESDIQWKAITYSMQHKTVKTISERSSTSNIAFKVSITKV